MCCLTLLFGAYVCMWPANPIDDWRGRMGACINRKADMCRRGHSRYSYQSGRGFRSESGEVFLTIDQLLESLDANYKRFA
jgi:hypothetical protein